MLIVNPILKGFNPDPSICRVDDTYYIATSTFEWFPGVQIHKSTNLINWELVGHVLTKHSQLDLQGIPDSGGVWAPCLSYNDGFFYLVYSNLSTLGPTGFWDVSNYVTTSSSIDGEWSEPIYLNSSGFDASLFHDDDGKKYLLYMNMGEQIKQGNNMNLSIALREYYADEQKLSEVEHIIFRETSIKLCEGPHIYKVNGYYYLLVAEGGTDFAHAATLARSCNLLGSYEVHPHNPILSSFTSPTHPLQKAGHASMVKTAEGEWYLAHLTSRPLPDETVSRYHHRGYCPLGRETALQVLEWRDGWPYVVNGPLPAIEVVAPKGASNIKPIEPITWRDDFNSLKLDPNWASLRASSFNHIYSLSERAGFLRLYGKESLYSCHTKALIARRWQAFNFEATTAIEFRPFNDEQQAGLVCYYNTTNWTACTITYCKEKGRLLALLACEAGIAQRPLYKDEIVIADNCKTVYLKVVVIGIDYSYSYSFDGQNWQTLNYQFDSRKLSDDYIIKQKSDGFTGAFVGLYCVDNYDRKLNADFDFFSYNEK